MFITAALSAVWQDNETASFLSSALLTGFIGGGLWLAGRDKNITLTTKQAFLLTVISWFVLTTFAALPLATSSQNLSYTDAFFEAMSGLSTTGATILQNLEETPASILLWRSFLQWLGGIGIIVFAIAVLPALQIGGMQLFRTESSDNSEKILPRTRQIANGIALLYAGLSLLCAVSYHLAGMPVFDAALHAMTTVATGGFSTYDNSLSAFQTGGVQIVSMVFMLVCSLPFVLIMQALRTNISALVHDEQVRLFLLIALGLVIFLFAYRFLQNSQGSLYMLQETAFNTISLLTGTGYSSTSYDTWGAGAVGVLFFTMFLGGCAGSTSCGLKTFRLQVLYQVTNRHLRCMTQSHKVFVPRFNKKPLSQSVMTSTLCFFFIFIACFLILTVALTLLGLDNLTALSAAASAIANVGPGLGVVLGPNATYALLPDAAKWVLCLGMFLGRLELLTVLVLLTPTFWRK